MQEVFLGLRSTATCRQVVARAIEDMRALSGDGRRPIAICCGKITTGEVDKSQDHKLQNYSLLKGVIAQKKKESGAEVVFDHLPYYQRAVELQRREYGVISVPAIGALAPPTGDRVRRDVPHAIAANLKRREQLKKEFLDPLLESGFIKTVYILPDSENSIGVKWWVEKAIELHIAVKPSDFA